MTAPQTQHLLATRFSVRMGADPLWRSRPWLQERLELLRRFCLPSVAAQSSDGFAWLLLCDEATDPEVVAELHAHEAELPALRVAMTSEAQPPLAALRSFVHPETEVLITTRLDSDDAIADTYLEAVQDYAEPFRRCGRPQLLVNFPRGFRLDSHSMRLHESHMFNGPFHSLFERPRGREAKTVFCGGHATLHEAFPTHQDESMRAWLVVVHGGNLHNRIPAEDPECERSQLCHFGLEPGRGVDS